MRSSTAPENTAEKRVPHRYRHTYLFRTNARLNSHTSLEVDSTGLMERYESAGASAAHACLPLTSSYYTPRGVADSLPRDAANYFIAMQAVQRARSSQQTHGNESWEKLAHAACILSELEQQLDTRASLLSKHDTVPHVNTGECRAQLEKLEDSLDKLLSSFHNVVFDPADAMYSSVLCTASSRTATESLTTVLALAPCLEALRAGIEKRKVSTCSVLSVLSNKADLPSTCLHVAAKLDELEKQLVALEAVTTNFKKACQGAHTVFDAISEAYVAWSSDLPRQTKRVS
jgi:hypothetical protein